MMIHEWKILICVGKKIFVNRRVFLKKIEMIFHDPSSVLKMPSQIRRREINLLSHQKPKPGKKRDKNGNF
jgi:hypothetical protein